MTRREKLGLLILITLFVVFLVLLAYTTRTWGPPRAPEDSFFVQKRIENLQR